ncbi:MAG: DUF5671 domain-containing protein [Bacillota bacterium]
MEPTQQPSRSGTSPKDFFLWLGAIIALYGSITSFIALKFEYINRMFPDPLASYADPYGGPVRVAMAGIIVLVPTLIALLWLIHRSIVAEPGKAGIWVRRWAVGFTLFLAAATMLIDLVTLINVFLGGEVTVRFGLKVLTILVIAGIAFLYFLADIRGYWVRHADRARITAIVVAIGAAAAVVAGFFIIGSPAHIRQLRLDSERVSDLQGIQYQVVNYFQQKRSIPQSLTDLNDPLTNYSVPTDPLTGVSYTYQPTGKLSFKLCATFSAPSPVTEGRGPTELSMPAGPDVLTGNWQHEAGETCFDRTIDPERYPPLPTTKSLQ